VKDRPVADRASQQAVEPATGDCAPAAAASNLTASPLRVEALQRSLGNAAIGRLARSPAGRRTLARLATRSPRQTLARRQRLPGFSQGDKDICGAASMVSALLIQDRDRADTTEPNRALVRALDNLLRLAPAGDAKTTVQTVRDKAASKAAMSESDYQSLSAAIASLYAAGGGMSSEELHTLSQALGFGRPGAGESGTDLRDILSKPAVSSLKPGQVGQLSWIADIPNRGQVGHVVVVGRHVDGKWFLSDQGPAKPLEIEADSHPDLVKAVSGAVTYKTSWLYGGKKSDFLQPPVTGFRRLGPDSLNPGEKLCEIDAGWRTTGETLTTWDFHSAHWSETAAKDAIARDPGPHGGVIVELGSGVFHVFKTNTLEDKNAMETKIDASDSQDGVLVTRRKDFAHAWLVLAHRDGRKEAPFQVF
jgi:hypothetical protein